MENAGQGSVYTPSAGARLWGLGAGGGPGFQNRKGRGRSLTPPPSRIAGARTPLMQPKLAEQGQMSEARVTPRKGPPPRQRGLYLPEWQPRDNNVHHVTVRAAPPEPANPVLARPNFLRLLAREERRELTNPQRICSCVRKWPARSWNRPMAS